MTPGPNELAACRGGEICQYMSIFFTDRDGDIRGSERVRLEHFLKAASEEQLNRADVFYATRMLFERLHAMGDTQFTRDLITTFRTALKEAAITRAANGQPADATKAADELAAAPAEDHAPGPRRAFGR
jgi:hypothetical protein